MRATGIHAQDGVVVEVRLLDEDDLRGFASGSLDPLTTEAIEAYLLHHPRAASRVAAYRRAAQQSLPKPPRLM